MGVLYRIEPGWHIYWKYSGDSGIPTKIEWQLAQGFKVGDLQWPLPLRDEEPGDLEVFDYTSEVLLFADVEAPATLPAPTDLHSGQDRLVSLPESVRSWTSRAVAQLDGRRRTRASDTAQTFQKFVRWSQSNRPTRSRVGFSRIGKNLVISRRGSKEGGRWIFFRFRRKTPSLATSRRSRNGLTIPIDTEVKPMDRMEGVLVVGSGDSRKG